MTTIRSLAAARAFPPQGRRRRATRPLRPADLPGASYFAPQGRHISRGTHEACCSCIVLHIRVCACSRGKTRVGRLSAPNSSLVGTARAMTTPRHRRSAYSSTPRHRGVAMICARAPPVRRYNTNNNYKIIICYNGIMNIIMFRNTTDQRPRAVCACALHAGTGRFCDDGYGLWASGRQTCEI